PLQPVNPQPNNFMSDSENRTEIAELREQCAGLGQQVKTLLYGLVVASFTLTAFLGLEARRAGKELETIQPQAMQVAETAKREESNIGNFLGKLVDFGSPPPDYAAIPEKYNVKQRPTPTTAAAPAAKP